ncbi:MAG: DUF1847 domain-containing protein [Bacteroidetes bacterium]|nr:DUF1847 domain-containing protein [Bacteroidota bacterium]
MDCINCNDKICRKQHKSCNLESFDKGEIISQYQEHSNDEIVKAAAKLVDDGRAGTLSRIQEIIEFSKTMNYKKLGLAYCYGMEKYAKEIKILFEGNDIALTPISCSVGGIKQSEVNSESCIHKVSCNPIGQAKQLNAENLDLTMILGICLGHDILLQRNLKMDFTTIVVKDRVYNHNPILALK